MWLSLTPDRIREVLEVLARARSGEREPGWPERDGGASDEERRRESAIRIIQQIFDNYPRG